MNNTNILAEELLICIKSLFKSSVSILHNTNSLPRDMPYSGPQGDSVGFLSIVFSMILWLISGLQYWGRVSVIFQSNMFKKI